MISPSALYDLPIWGGKGFYDTDKVYGMYTFMKGGLYYVHSFLLKVEMEQC